MKLNLTNKIIKIMAPPIAKRPRLTKSKASTTSKVEETSSGKEIEVIKREFEKKRDETAKSIIEFPFNKKRVRIISQEQLVRENCKGIVYWMSRDSRVQDNWAFLFAQKLALKNRTPLHVCFCLIAKYLDASVRQFHFLIKGNIQLLFINIVISSSPAIISSLPYIYIQIALKHKASKLKINWSIRLFEHSNAYCVAALW